MIEVYVGLWDSNTRKLAHGMTARIDPQRSIAAAAQAVHKISLADLAGKPVWKDVAHNVRQMLEKADLVVGHNWNGFDAPFIDGELVRVGLPKLTKPTFDTMLEGRWATPTGLIPNLGALCFACGVEYDSTKAHAAEYDVDKTMECFFKGLEWGFYELPQTAVRNAA